MDPSSSGWFSYSPVDPASLDRLTDEQRAMIDQRTSDGAPELVGEVHVLVHDLRAGQSEVRVTAGPRGAESSLLRTAIRELQAALDVFDPADPPGLH
jgi:hypothetical protein